MAHSPTYEYRIMAREVCPQCGAGLREFCREPDGSEAPWVHPSEPSEWRPRLHWGRRKQWVARNREREAAEQREAKRVRFAVHLVRAAPKKLTLYQRYLWARKQRAKA